MPRIAALFLASVFFVASLSVLGAEPEAGVAPFDTQQAQTLQRVWAKRMNQPVARPNSQQTDMVLIPPGKFQMGSSDEQVAGALKLAQAWGADEHTQKRIREAERPQHPVSIAKPFMLAATEVTIGQFRQFVEATSYQTDAERLRAGNSATTVPAKPGAGNEFFWTSPGFAQKEASAVSQVSWNDAVEFCNWLSRKEGLTPAYQADDKIGWKWVENATGYRLPTESEWEWAARAGTVTQYYFGDDPQQLSRHGYFGSKSGSTPMRKVGDKPANPFGLHDMHGNVCEWCQDFYDPTSYPTHYVHESPHDGVLKRAVRGGDWWGNALRSRSAFRGYGDQISRSDDLGFRLARSIPAGEQQ